MCSARATLCRGSARVDPHQRRATPRGCAVGAPPSAAVLLSALAMERRRVAPMHWMCSTRAALRRGSARVDPHQRGAAPGGCAVGAPPSAATLLAALLAALGLERRRVAKAAHGSGCSVVSAGRNSSARRLSLGGPNIITLT